MNRQRPNVAEQNAIEAARIRDLTIEFRRHARDPVGLYEGWRSNFPPGLFSFLAEKNVDASRAVLLQITTAEQGTNPVVGLLLTDDGRFMEFDLHLDESGTRVIAVDLWEDRAPEQNLSPRNAGFGNGQGCLALAVQRELAHAG